MPTPLAGLAPGATIALDPDDAKHARVLRLRDGSGVELCDGRGRVVGAVVAAGGGGGAGTSPPARNSPLTVTLTAQPTLVPWYGPAWVLAVGAGGGLARGGRDDWLVEKAVELGAAGVWPLSTARAPWKKEMERERERGDGDVTTTLLPPGIPPRWARVARAAVKQSLRAHGLAWTEPASVTGPAVAGAIVAAPLALVAAAGAPPIAAVLSEARRGGWMASAADPAAPCLLFVGPEGDFTGEEVAALVAAGARPVGLGPHRLRVETAAVAGLAAVMLT